jgi:hypothetical protein
MLRGFKLLGASGNPVNSPKTSETIRSILAGIDDYRLLLDAARQLSLAGSSFANLKDEAARKGVSLADEAIGAAKTPQEGLMILEYLARKQHWDIGDSAGVIIRWNALPPARRSDFATAGGSVWYEYLALVFRSLIVSGRDADAIPGLYWKPIVEFDRFHFEGSVQGEYNEEKADPWVDPFTGKIEGGTGVKAGAKIGIGADKVAAVSLSATGQANVTGFIQFGAHGRKLCLDEYKVTIGELKGAATIKVKLIGWIEWETDLVKHTFFEGIKLPESKAPSEPVVLYTIPDPA